ncbi:MAG: glycosyltransferase [Candidatus Aminicenantes bacterium]|nr:MAG: glycosyltransferase [Candidatus Aminicenantes bacterium]
MRILFLEEQPCIRALKYAKGLRSNYKDIELYFGYRGLTLDGFYGHGEELFVEWFKLNSNTALTLKSIVDKINPDIIHSHNAPDSLTVAAIQAFKGVIPIVHDVHDLMTIRHTAFDDGIERMEAPPDRIEHEEKIALEKSDGVIAVSEAILEIASQKYNLDGQKNLVFPNYIVNDMIPQVFKDKVSRLDGTVHIVYEGHLDGKRSGGHYDLYDIFKEIAGQAIHMHIYPSRETDFYKKLSEEEIFIYYHGSLPPPHLMVEITQYDFGWSGFNAKKNRDHVDTVLANKTIEYISAGLPVISFPHKAQKRFIEKHGVGLVIDDISELSEKLKTRDIEAIKRRVQEKRYSFTIEKQIGKIYQFYRNIIANF